MADAFDTTRFGVFIGRKRTELGLSQAAVAKRVGISRPYLSQIESGDRTPSDELVSNLLIALGSPMEEFIRDVVGDALTDDQKDAAAALTAPMEFLATKLSAEDLLEFSRRMDSLERMAVNLNTLSTEPIPIGPDGWLDLGKEDRRLVQRIVNRLLASK